MSYKVCTKNDFKLMPKLKSDLPSIDFSFFRNKYLLLFHKTYLLAAAIVVFFLTKTKSMS